MKNVIAALLAVVSVGVSAQTYNARVDYDGDRVNPVSGPWVYGFIDLNSSGGYTFKWMDWPDNSTGQYVWRSSGTHAHVWRNDGAVEITGVKPGQLSMHPGAIFYAETPMRQAAAIRFVTPEAGKYSVWTKFYTGHSGETSAWVVLNSGFASPIFTSATTSAEPSVYKELTLSAGDKLTFIVGSADGWDSDNTPVNIVINKID